ncbi:MAG: FecR domain-containing protein [Acidobacteria bacterium]|nr:FecR domain-containing protein [Acidobacteriota bacterium]
MNEKHYTERLSAFVNHELPKTEQQSIAEHLLVCAGCRAVHDEIKYGAALAMIGLKPEDAPDALWHKIEKALDDDPRPSVFASPAAGLGFRAVAAAALLLVAATAAYLVIRPAAHAPETAVREDPSPFAQPAISPDATVTPSANAPGNARTNAANPSSPPNPPPVFKESNTPVAPQVRPAPALPPPLTPAWNVETLAGLPKIGNSFAGARLAVGEVLETDANSRARVEVADIGDVEIAPNSRVRLVETKATAHRLALEKGTLSAKILAPPRLFIVDTPSAVAVDLGCEYTLEVDPRGNGRLQVTIGYVALERGGREAIVPAGTIAFTRKDAGLGTPFSENASPAFRDALYRFDFENGGAPALATVLDESADDSPVTLWHLLSRVEIKDRGKVFDALASRVAPPPRVTRAGVLKLDKKMLAAWWKAVEKFWFA